MKKILMIVLAVPFFVLAQVETDTTRDMETTEEQIIVSQDVNECVNKIHNNPAVIKLFLRNLAMDKDRMRDTYKQLANDPEIKRLVEQIRHNLKTDEQIKNERQY